MNKSIWVPGSWPKNELSHTFLKLLVMKLDAPTFPEHLGVVISIRIVLEVIEKQKSIW